MPLPILYIYRLPLRYFFGKDLLNTFKSLKKKKLIADINETKFSEDLLKKTSAELQKIIIEKEQSEKFNNLIFENNPDSIFVKDTKFRIVSANQNFINMYPKEKQKKVIGYTTLEDYKPDEVDLFLEMDKKAFTDGFSETVETVNFPDGVCRVFHTKKIRFEGNNNEQYILGICKDVTEQKQFEEKLRISEERFSLAMRGANDGLWDWDIKTDEIYYSPRWKSMLGYTEGEITSHLSEWVRLVHKDDEKAALSEAESCKAGLKIDFEVEIRMQHKNGHYLDILSRAFVVKDDKGEVSRLVGTHVDITSRKRAEEQLSYQASHDALTNLINRREFEKRAEHLLSTVKQHHNEHALCFVDLDQFKLVNDTCGHAAGDELLRQLSVELQKKVRHSDTLARLGGDEFGILMKNCSLGDAHRVTDTLQKTIQNFQFSWAGHNFKIGASLGLVPITEMTSNIAELLIEADAACYIAKHKGGNRTHVYHANDSEIAQRHGEIKWVTRIQNALEEGRFSLYAQSITPLNNNTGKHYELLIRMINNNGEVIPPGSFLPAAERYNLINQIDRWVIENSFRLMDENPVFQSQVSFISINLSGQSLAEQDTLDFIVKELSKTGIESKKVCFEITETAAISNLVKAKEFISTLKELGCRFALDDFGSGLSSFAYLKNLPVDYLKIDGMFVKDIVNDPIDYAMVKSINDIGHVMGMQTIAEFVENDEIKNMLRVIGVDYVQGYGIDKPAPFDGLLRRSVNITDIKVSSDET